MIRNPNPNRELDREPYWNLDEISLTVIVRIRQNVEYFHIFSFGPRLEFRKSSQFAKLACSFRSGRPGLG